MWCRISEVNTGLDLRLISETEKDERETGGEDYFHGRPNAGSGHHGSTGEHYLFEAFSLHGVLLLSLLCYFTILTVFCKLSTLLVILVVLLVGFLLALLLYAFLRLCLVS